MPQLHTYRARSVKPPAERLPLERCPRCNRAVFRVTLTYGPGAGESVLLDHAAVVVEQLDTSFSRTAFAHVEHRELCR